MAKKDREKTAFVTPKIDLSCGNAIGLTNASGTNELGLACRD